MIARLVVYILLVMFFMLPKQEAYGEDAVLLNQYDANGSLVNGDGKFYQYNDANQLVKVCGDAACASTVAEYLYDHTGQRVKKIENGVTTYYLGKHYETQVKQGQAQNTRYYFAGSDRVAKKDIVGTYFYHPDHLGGVSAVTDSSVPVKVVNSTSYLPFGEVRQGGSENYYTGKESDKASGLYNFEARYVSPELRHFTQADIAEPDFDDPQDLNRYAYVGNNPLSFVDDDGYKKKKKNDKKKKKKKSKHKSKNINYVDDSGEYS
ncbi:tRNA3(Ser)-specific nuclease WapA [Geobacter sp. OR-1]|uniref:RHS repeat-associated core domain-containing protein n=1 Tax=Geobacter sp. OR-1 TaxID=1266765 RepID=UPI0005422EA8|nr:RHS repeat-associated core domain-containing protein [Geobacter sp. OR-1]GAM11326.1 tRNA3(Ser)-specific nuclease WapA [Geobacter sp. OR-1]